MDRPEARGQALPTPGPSSQAPPGILSHPGRGGGEQPVLSNQQYISSFNPSNSPVRSSCYLMITSKHKTCYPPPHPRFTGATHTQRFSNCWAHGWGAQGWGSTQRRSSACAQPERTQLPGPNPLLSQTSSGLLGGATAFGLSRAAAHLPAAATRGSLRSLGLSIFPGKGGTLTLPRDTGARILGLSCQPPCVPPLPGRPPG